MLIAHNSRTIVSEGRCSVEVLEDERSTFIVGKVDGEWVIRASAARRSDAFRGALAAARVLREMIEERS